MITAVRRQVDRAHKRKRVMRSRTVVRAQARKARKRAEPLPEILTVDEAQLTASVCRDSFYDFVKRFWSVIIPEEPVWNWHMKALCDILQTAAERIFLGLPCEHDIVINVPPGTSKSTIASVMFPAWMWTRMPSARAICTSYTHDLALDLALKSRDIVKSEKWQQLFGDVELREDSKAKGHYANKHGGMRHSVGTGGSVMGFHGHVIIVDDPLDPTQAVSEAELKTANKFITETLPTRKIDKQVTLTVLIMQRLHQNDPAANMLAVAKDNGFPIKHINLPASVDGNGLDVVRPRKLAKHYSRSLENGAPAGVRYLDTARLPYSTLKIMHVKMGNFAYSGQMMQNPVPLGGGMFHTDRLKLDNPPAMKHFKQLCRFWDKAGTEGGGAFTAGVLMGEDQQGRFWVLDVVRGQWESSQRERIIVQTAALDTFMVQVGLEQEPGSGGLESAQATVRRLKGYRVRVVRPTGSKELRADPYSVQVNGENVFLRKGEWNRNYVEEMKYFPESKYKDQIDASSGAFNLLTKPRVQIGSFGKPARSAGMRRGGR